MIERLNIHRLGPIEELQWDNLGAINLVIGGNGQGKSFLLKAMYAAHRVLEDAGRGDTITSVEQALVQKLHWTFQANRIGDLVTRGSEVPLDFEMAVDGFPAHFGFGRKAEKKIPSLDFRHPEPMGSSIFLPPKEVLSLHRLILETRDVKKKFGFDETYVDLARALGRTPKQGKNFAEFAHGRQRLRTLLGGKVRQPAGRSEWEFRKNGDRFAMGATAEGVKKLAILDTLLGNGHLRRDSVVFLDEPEAALHPRMLTGMLDIVAELAAGGMQFVMASHSYFVIKKLHLLALEREMSIPVLSLGEDGPWASDLREGMPDNPIVRESIRLYEEELEHVMGTT